MAEDVVVFAEAPAGSGNRCGLAPMRASGGHDVPAVPPTELEHRFRASKDLEETVGHGDRSEAERVLAEGRVRAAGA
ncbi:MAG TPA: hypothetical protein VNJ46_02685 [Gaiellaceae bacterium]|nr:hypothetical protein [Gaiellaceae bacterium]